MDSIVNLCAHNNVLIQTHENSGFVHLQARTRATIESRTFELKFFVVAEMKFIALAVSDRTNERELWGGLDG